MLNKSDNIVELLHRLGLTNEEAKIYIELLKEPTSHLRLAHATGINRTKVYRLADELEKRSLITKRTDDRGSFLVASDPSTLEVTLVTQEEKLKRQRLAFNQLMPVLTGLQQGKGREFAVHSYEGEDGFKQMLWHELKAKGENLIFGSGTIDDLVGNGKWAEKHRAMTVEAGYTIREILNPGEKEMPFTLVDEFMKNYVHREIAREILQLKNQISVYNDTVATYHWREEQKVGVEILNKNHALTMRQIFEQYWQLAR